MPWDFRVASYARKNVVAVPVWATISNKVTSGQTDGRVGKKWIWNIYVWYLLCVWDQWCILPAHKNVYLRPSVSKIQWRVSSNLCLMSSVAESTTFVQKISFEEAFAEANQKEKVPFEWTECETVSSWLFFQQENVIIWLAVMLKNGISPSGINEVYLLFFQSTTWYLVYARVIINYLQGYSLNE